MFEHRIKTRHLHGFLQAAQRRKMSLAANALSVSQPALSKTIKELEDILGVRLFERSPMGVSLTHAGEIFYRQVQLGLGSIKMGIDSIKQCKAEARAPIAIGVLPTAAALIMPRAIHYFSQAGLGHNIHLYDGHNALLLDQLRRGDIDLMIGRLSDPTDMQDLSFIHLYSEQICIVVRPEHKLLKDTKKLSLSDIAHYQVLMPLTNAIIRATVDSLLISHGVSHLPNHIETNLARFGRQYVQQSDAVWITSRSIVADDILRGLVVELPFSSSDTHGPVGLTYRPGSAKTPELQAMTDAIRRAVQELHAELGTLNAKTT